MRPVEMAKMGEASAIAWPSGGFQWTDELRKLLPVVRGVHVPPTLTDTLTALPNAMVLPDDHPSIGRQQHLNALAASAGRSWTYWGRRGSRKRITHKALNQPDFEYWLELIAQSYVGDSNDVSWTLCQCAKLHGLPNTVKAVATLPELLQVPKGWLQSGYNVREVLRALIATADDATYEEVRPLVERLRVQDPQSTVVCSYIFPNISEWAVECIEQRLDDPLGLLLSCALPPRTFVRYMKNRRCDIESIRPELLLQILVHGEAAFDVLAVALSQSHGLPQSVRHVLKLVTNMHAPQMLSLLVRELKSDLVRTALDAMALQYPAAAIHCGIEQAVLHGDRTAEVWAVRLALREPVACACALAALEQPTRIRFEATLAALQPREATPDQLPVLLRATPSPVETRTGELPTLDVVSFATAETINWPEHARDLVLSQECARTLDLPGHLRNPPLREKFPEWLELHPDGVKRLLAGQLLQKGDVAKPPYRGTTPEFILVSPKNTQLLLWNSYPAAFWSTRSDHSHVVRVLLAQHGSAALPGFFNYVAAMPEKAHGLIHLVDSPRMVDIVLHMARNLKKSKDAAQAWIRRYPRTVLVKALPQAFQAGPSAKRDNARFAVLWMVNNGFAALTSEVAKSYGPITEGALQTLLCADPLLAVARKRPTLPAFCSVASFRRAVLPTGEALPSSAMELIASMLATSRLDAPYAGLEIVKQACTPTSLAEFVWDLFEAWTAAGSPSKEGWAFTALGLLGDDETARRLAPRICAWPGESAHARAVSGLDLLATIGSDVALMHLNGIAGTVKFKALQEHAKEKITQVAQARGFTSDELADRLVPDLGLDDDGRLELNFGPRQFFVAFDEALKPFVKDSQGVRLKDLPKPIKSDDAELAETASARYKQMKKDAKAIASLQITRLEMAMVVRRRWSATAFKRFFIEHPLMRHLATRVVWGVYENTDSNVQSVDARLLSGLRITEDWSLADAQDNTYTLPSEARVGVSHILEMPRAMQEAFGQIFGDYEILQPFKQLGRENYSLTADEQKQSSLTRFVTKVVATGSVMGLVDRGWNRGKAQEGGWVGEFSKDLGDNLQVVLELDPGTVVGDMPYEPTQKLPSLTLRKRGSNGTSGLSAFGELAPILVSEVLRDCDLLAPLKENT